MRKNEGKKTCEDPIKALPSSNPKTQIWVTWDKMSPTLFSYHHRIKCYIETFYWWVKNWKYFKCILKTLYMQMNFLEIFQINKIIKDLVKYITYKYLINLMT